MSIRMKRGVVMTGSHPCLFAILAAAKYAYDQVGVEVVITSGVDGTHSPNSLHYEGKALDIRTRNLTDAQRVEVMDYMTIQLGPDYDVLFEGDHFHVEFDPA